MSNKPIHDAVNHLKQLTVRERLHIAVGGVLVNAFNYPERVQTRILGQDMQPLIERVVDAVLESEASK